MGGLDYWPGPSFALSVLVDWSFLLFFKVFFAIFLFPSFELPLWGSARLPARLAPLSLAILGGI